MAARSSGCLPGRRSGKRCATFIGDIAAFTGEPTISACVAVEPTDVIAFDRAALRDMVARWPEFGEHGFRTLLARRAWHEAEGHGVMRLIAAASGSTKTLNSAAGVVLPRPVEPP